MKKLITLLLVLTGMVSTANAWTDVYLRCNVTPSGKSNAWDNDLDHFSKINDNDFVLKIDGSIIHEGALWFRANVYGWGQVSPAKNDNDNIDMTGDYAYNTSWTGTTYYFIIQQKASANAIYIRVKWDKTVGTTQYFNLYALVTEDSYTVTYTDPYDWNGVSAFAQYNDIPLNGTGAGGSMSGSHPNYSVTIPAKPGAKITFAKTADAGNKTSELDFVNKGNYTYSGLQTVKASISSVGYATFSSAKALDFSSEGTIEACKAAVDAYGNITYTKVTSVAANEGVLLRRADKTIASAASDIPLHANQSVAANTGNQFVAITAKQKLDKVTETGYTNFILAKPAEVLGFFKVNDSGSWCNAGTAYLKVADGSIPSARDFFALDDETTSIEAVKAAPVANGEYYNLSGQRVAQPTKGLYIVNGKKLINK